MKPIPAHAKRVRRGGKEYARWKGRGNAGWIEGEVRPDGRCNVESPNWWVEWEEDGERRREKVGPDKAAAEYRCAELVQLLQRNRLGLGGLSVIDAATTINDLATEYSGYLSAMDRNAQHVHDTEHRITRVSSDCRWVFLRDVTFSTWIRWVGEQRKEPYNLSAETINHYLRSLRSFFRWLIKTKRLVADPLFAAELLNADADRRLVRRVLKPDEFRHFIATTRESIVVRMGLTGVERAALYLFAARTGLRAGVLRQLRRRDVKEGDEIPHVTVPARRQKSRHEHRVPIAEETLAELRPFLATRAPDELLWSFRNAAWFMVKRDLVAARIEPHNEEGRYDFHALRSQCGTDLALAGVPLTVVQKFLDHSTPVLTAKLYARHGLSDLAEAAEQLGSGLGCNNPELTRTDRNPRGKRKPAKPKRTPTNKGESRKGRKK